MRAPAPLSVAVLIELEQRQHAGGHVKCWEHLARAATTVPELDLTLYTLGRRPEVETWSPTVRWVRMRPVVGTRALTRLVGGVDASDMTPYHPGLARALPRHDLWHLTHSMGFTATALRVRHRRPIVASLHTDVPFLTASYTDQVLDALPRPLGGAVRATHVDRVPQRLARRVQDRTWRAATHVLVANDEDRGRVAGTMPADRVSLLRRGVDTELFRPRRSDRALLTSRYGVPPDGLRVLFVGRVDRSKGVPLLADAVAILRRGGMPVHLVVAGEGAETERLHQQLGEAVTTLGRVDHTDLAHVYAGCDAFAFPSRSETAGNVVGEAMAAGLPVLLPQGARTTRWIDAPGEDGLVVPGEDACAWAQCLRAVLADGELRSAIGARAQQTIERRHPSWQDVFEQDLLPVWRRAVVG